MNETLERRSAYRRGASSKAKLVGIQGVAALLDCSPEQAHKEVLLPGFPAPIDKPGDRKWRECDIEAWLESLV